MIMTQWLGRGGGASKESSDREIGSTGGEGDVGMSRDITMESRQSRSNLEKR